MNHNCQTLKMILGSKRRLPVVASCPTPWLSHCPTDLLNAAWIPFHLLHLNAWCSEITPYSLFTHIPISQVKKKDYSGAGMAEWLSSQAPLQWPRVSLVGILGVDVAPLIRPCWGSIPHSTTRGVTTRIYNYVLVGFEEKKKKQKKKIGNSC